MSDTHTITSPTGKRWIFPRDLGRYRGLVHRNDMPCEHGHFGCAAWEGGPCFDELLARHEADDDEQYAEPERDRYLTIIEDIAGDDEQMVGQIQIATGPDTGRAYFVMRAGPFGQNLGTFDDIGGALEAGLVAIGASLPPAPEPEPATDIAGDLQITETERLILNIELGHLIGRLEAAVEKAGPAPYYVTRLAQVRGLLDKLGAL